MANFMAGFQAKASVNGSAYAFATYRVRSTTMRHDVSNTEGLAGNAALGNVSQLGAVANFTDVPIFTSKLPGLASFEATVRQATFDLANDPFGLPWGIINGFYLNVVVFYAAAGPNWSCPSLLIGEVDSDGDVRGLQPVSFSGESDGEYEIVA